MVDKDQLRADASEAEDQVEADHQEQFNKQAQEMSGEEYGNHMSRLREQSISADFDKIVKRLKGSTLYGETTDLGDLQELVCVSYALGVAEGVKLQANRQKFKYTRGHKKDNLH